MKTSFARRFRRFGVRGRATPTRPARAPNPLAAVAMVVLLAVLAPQIAAGSTARKQEARLQYDKAQQMREALNGRPADERTRREYQKVIDAYRKVYYVNPASSKADASVIAVAELLAEMGRQFQPGEKDLHSAIGQYEFLRKEYPGSKYRVEALFTIGQIYKEDLGDPDAAKATFREFVRRYPHDQRVPEAEQALAELAQPKGKVAAEAKVVSKAPSVAANSSSVHADEADDVEGALYSSNSEGTPLASLAAPEKKHSMALVTGVRHWSSPDSTRVAIDVDGPVKYQAGRVPHPDRIFFDLPDTKLVSTLIGKSFEVQDGFLKKIRIAQYQRGATRVVLEVEDVSEYSAFLLPNPYRLIIDVHGRDTVAQSAKTFSGDATAQTQVETDAENGRSSRSILSGNVTTAPKKQTATRAAQTVTKPGTPVENPSSAGNGGEARSTSSDKSDRTVHRVVVEDGESRAADQNSPSKNGNTVAELNPATKPADMRSADSKSVRGDSDSSAAKNRDKPLSAKAAVPGAGVGNKNSKDPLFAEPGDSKGPELKATPQPTTAPTAVAVAPRSIDTKKSTKLSSTAAVPATHEAAPTSAGERSLTRALGLKIGRIVIDAGHGGHDTGTIGPNGLMEKDLVLDVALRLGRLLETRLSADVIYTRDDDTFIPLETRTAIANQQEADLFISVHANSSSDPNARGIETYYLNFTTNADALEVAARENAVSDKSVHELQDLVKKITLKDKIEESRELASDVQQSLCAGVAGKNSAIKNRGVKKAPFVVLIGANMPSILAEIAFVSNPSDEKKLETPEYRQKIAESMYKGIAKYTGGLSGVKVASKGMKDAGQ